MFAKKERTKQDNGPSAIDAAIGLVRKAKGNLDAPAAVNDREAAVARALVEIAGRLDALEGGK